MQEILQQLVNGIGVGAIYALIAVGYTMVYGILGLINFAHSDVFMLAPVAVVSLYLPLALYSMDANWGVAVTGLLISMLACGAVGFLIERVAYRPLRQPYGAVTCAVVMIAVPLFLLGVSAAIPAKAAVTSGDPSQLSEIMRAGGSPTNEEIAAGLAVRAERVAEKTADDWRVVVRVLALGVFLYGFGLFLNRFAFAAGAGKADRLTALITALGVSLFLEAFLQLKEVYGARAKNFPGETFSRPGEAPIEAFRPGRMPEFSGVSIGGVNIPTVDIIVLTVTLVLMLVLTWVVKRTRIGTAMRAVSYSHDSARLMGINVNAVISFTFVLGSILAAVGGMLYAGKYQSVDWKMGMAPGIKAFVAAVLGGIGNIPGAVLGSFIMGISETQVANVPLLSPFKDGVAFVILIVILLFRPAGLLGRNVPEKV